MIEVKNKLYKTAPYILHCPNDNPEKLWFTVSNFCKNHNLKIRVPPNVSIITFNNTSRKMLLEEILDFQKINYTTLGSDIKIWRNPLKIKLLKDHLDKVETEFILVLDAEDVVIIKTLENIIDDFNKFHCSVVFNASCFVYPGHCKHTDNESKISNSYFRYLNSGCFFGYTKFCKDLYDKCYLYEDEITSRYRYSDQIKLKAFYVNLYPKIKIDTECQIFQVCNATVPMDGIIEVNFKNLCLML